MNKRIYELAEHAGIKITPMIVDGIEYEYEYVDMDGSEDLAKFAELIVKECMMLVEGFEITQEVALDEYVDYEASAVLKEHFGVEE
jgi:hypothetical protein